MINNNDLICLKRVLERDHEANVGTPIKTCQSDACFQKRVIEWIDSHIVHKTNNKEEANEQ